MAEEPEQKPKKSNAGRPKGKRSDERIWLARLARQHAEKAIRALVKNLDDENGSVRNQAARELLDRGYGRAPQEIILEDGAADDLVDKPRALSQLLDLAEDVIGPGAENPSPTSG